MRHGEAKRLPAITIETADLPEHVLALLDHHLLDLADAYGDPNAGDPIQYAVWIERDEGAVGGTSTGVETRLWRPAQRFG